jgi:hypothetical protein
MKKSLMISMMCVFICSTAYASGSIDCSRPLSDYSFGGPTVVQMYYDQCRGKWDNKTNSYYQDGIEIDQNDIEIDQDYFYDNHYDKYHDDYSKDDYSDSYYYNGYQDDCSYNSELEEYYRGKRKWANDVSNIVMNDLIQRHLDKTLQYGMYLSPQLMDDITTNGYKYHSKFNECLSDAIYNDSDNVNNFIEGNYDVALRLSGYVRNCWMYVIR